MANEHAEPAITWKKLVQILLPLVSALLMAAIAVLGLLWTEVKETKNKLEAMQLQQAIQAGDAKERAMKFTMTLNNLSQKIDELKAKGENNE